MTIRLFRIAFTCTVCTILVFGCEKPLRAPHLRDADNRIVIYHGVNVSNYSKYSADFLPWQTKDDFARLNNWGFNVVRYLVFWEAIEPQEGVYDEEYLDATVERIGWLEELGIDVIVDLHQDLYSGRYGGDGFPDWAINDNGEPFTPQEPWNLNYLQPAVIACFNNFWASDALKAKYVNMVEHLLNRVDDLPNVIGLDIMNEPYGADDVHFEQTTLSRFYRDVQDMHTENGFDTPLYFEPRILTSGGLKTNLAFNPQEGSVYAPHYYELLSQFGLGYPETSKLWTERAVKMRVDDARAFGTPLFFGEFGIHGTADSDYNYLNDLLELFDYYQIGWAYWSYDVAHEGGYGLIDDNGDETTTLQIIVRMYPQRIAGDDPEWSLGEQSFDLTYTANDSSAPTVIFVPMGLASVQVWQNGQAISYDNISRYLSIPNVGGAGTKQTIHIEWSQPG
ncbi:MAG: cellulase family glycosylhydrolase [Candidatus Hydrogenedentes bacterium]|nr:cellulase family glycosylhydrolase [Candidatus Hydrogenedentota bacterium]